MRTRRIFCSAVLAAEALVVFFALLVAKDLTDVSGAVGAVVIADAPVDRLREGARKLLSAFKVPTVWLLVDSDDAIPRGATGKVDIAALKKMLVTPREAQR